MKTQLEPQMAKHRPNEGKAKPMENLTKVDLDPTLEMKQPLIVLNILE